MILIPTPGKVGREAARLLAGTDTRVRLLARDPDKLQDIAAIGVEIVAGDLQEDASIRAALRGISQVILVSLAIPEQELRVIAAAKDAQIDHVVKITSKASPDSPIARRRGQSEIEAGLIASGLNHTLLRNNAYMQNFLMLARAIAKTSSFGSSAGDGRVGLVDSRDVADVAVHIAREPKPHVNTTYQISGPQLLSDSDVATTLSDVLHRPIAFHPRTFDEDKRAMITAGVPEPIAEQNAQAFSLIATGDAEWLSDDINIILGHPGRTFEQFARDHATAFTA